MRVEALHQIKNMGSILKRYDRNRHPEMPTQFQALRIMVKQSERSDRAMIVKPVDIQSRVSRIDRIIPSTIIRITCASGGLFYVRSRAGEIFNYRHSSAKLKI